MCYRCDLIFLLPKKLCQEISKMTVKGVGEYLVSYSQTFN